MCSLIHLSFFISENVTNEVEEAKGSLDGRFAHFTEIVSGNIEPTILIGDHCSHPHECPFRRYCWADVREQSIFTIPNLSTQRKSEFIARGIIDLGDIDETCQLTDKQRKYVDRSVSGVVHIDNRAIERRLSQLVYPICFLDFEADSAAVPRIGGTAPYQQLAFQYSLH